MSGAEYSDLSAYERPRWWRWLRARLGRPRFAILAEPVEDTGERWAVWVGNDVTDALTEWTTLTAIMRRGALLTRVSVLVFTVDGRAARWSTRPPGTAELHVEAMRTRESA